MREVRLALLEADVNFKVTKDFVARVSERCVGSEVLKSLTPGQMVVKIVHEELTALMGGQNARLAVSSKPPTVILLCGLQGSGKTTFAGKLALSLKKGGKKPLLAACDVQRPAAVEQLITLGKQIDVPVHSGGTDPVAIARAAHKAAQDDLRDTLIIDTAGRLHIDEALMKQVSDISKAVNPTETLLVVDAMTGQDAVNIAQSFSQALNITGIVLTKLDGDARGGAALSMRAVTGKPIKFASVGEKIDQLEAFHPDRMASRILGMGDVLTLIERVSETVDLEKAAKMEQKLKTADFTLEDFLDQIQQLKKMGGMGEIASMLPGMKGKLDNAQIDEDKTKRMEAIIQSMTPGERKRPEIINASRRKRIARGSGAQINDINRLIGEFTSMKKMLKQMTGNKMMRKRGFKMPF
jgi:signal recognition particle subunit SRP54